MFTIRLALAIFQSTLSSLIAIVSCILLIKISEAGQSNRISNRDR